MDVGGRHVIPKGYNQARAGLDRLMAGEIAARVGYTTMSLILIGRVPSGRVGIYIPRRHQEIVVGTRRNNRHVPERRIPAQVCPEGIAYGSWQQVRVPEVRSIDSESRLYRDRFISRTYESTGSRVSDLLRTLERISRAPRNIRLTNHSSVSLLSRSTSSR